MQWTDGNGGAYGGDPYGGTGYAYAYGHEGGGTLDMDAPAWDPVGHTQGAYPADHLHFPVQEVQAAGMYHQGSGPDHFATTVWDGPHGEVLTVLPPELDTPGSPGPEQHALEHEPTRPVFVDSSGRRQRRVLRAARLLVIPAGGYVALLVSTMLGGPSISSPFVPQPDPTHSATPRVTAPDSPSRTGHSAGSEGIAEARANSRPAAQRTAGPSAASTAPAPAPAPTAAPASTSPAPASTAAPTPASTHPSSSRGRAIGASHNPVK